MADKLICALLFGEAESKEKAEKIAKSYRNCPYIDLMVTKENHLFASFILPEQQRWWIEFVEKKPRQTFGLEKATVTFVDNVYYPKKLKMRLPKKPTRISPCGANCETDPAYRRCLGCPATMFYKRAEK